MCRRHAVQARLFVALALVVGLFPLGASKPVEVVCPVPAVAMPTGCCREAAPPSCPSCPSDGRPSCPTQQPTRARTYGSVAALPPGDSTREARASRPNEPTTAAPPMADTAPVRSASIARRAAVTGTSPPTRLLACSFRN
ncbi:MAG: hypothetical protein IPN83_04500 [Holophagales bacterium]|nr:hypothetical protein [Holophagales bacterium]